MIHANYALGDAGADLYRRASGGDIEAQRELAEAALSAHEEAQRHEGLIDLAAIESLFWCRLAATCGDETDAMRLCAALPTVAAVFNRAGWGPMGDALFVETFTILHVAAANGNAEAISTLHDIAADVAPELLRRGREMAHNMVTRHAG